MTFPDNTIIFSHKREELEKLPASEVMDFIPEIKQDSDILASWMNFFQQKDVPFVVTKKKGNAVLWKQRKGFITDISRAL